MAARKKKVFKVERKTNSGKDGEWIRMKGQFATKDAAQEYIDARKDDSPFGDSRLTNWDIEYRIGKEDKV
tara:strand:- start:32 stop:241 length:210 start_codon:yes stop_codon:yes gene_type:complete